MEDVQTKVNTRVFGFRNVIRALEGANKLEQGWVRFSLGTCKNRRAQLGFLKVSDVRI